MLQLRYYQNNIAILYVFNVINKERKIDTMSNEDEQWKELIVRELDQIDGRLDDIDKKLDNHIVHLKSDIDDIQVNVGKLEECLSNWKWFIGLFLGIVLTIVGILIRVMTL